MVRKEGSIVESAFRHSVTCVRPTQLRPSFDWTIWKKKANIAAHETKLIFITPRIPHFFARFSNGWQSLCTDSDCADTRARNQSRHTCSFRRQALAGFLSGVIRNARDQPAGDDVRSGSNRKWTPAPRNIHRGFNGAAHRPPLSGCRQF